MNKTFRSIGMGAALAVGLFGATAGNAATITDHFKFRDSANAVLASGAFSYDAAKSGVLGFADLSAFTIHLDGHTYDLGFVNSVSNYEHFGFNTATNSFVGAHVSGSQGTFNSFMSAINDVYTAGFFISAGQTVADYGATITYTTYAKYSVSQTPVPPALLLLLSALGGLALLGWRRKATATT